MVSLTLLLSFQLPTVANCCKWFQSVAVDGFGPLRPAGLLQTVAICCRPPEKGSRVTPSADAKHRLFLRTLHTAGEQRDSSRYGSEQTQRECDREPPLITSPREYQPQVILWPRPPARHRSPASRRWHLSLQSPNPNQPGQTPNPNQPGQTPNQPNQTPNQPGQPTPPPTR